VVNFRKIKAIKLSDYFSYQRNTMITYRIIPHISVTNNQNSKMWRILHKMYEIYNKVPSRMSRNGFKFTYREKDTIWFDVIFRQENNEKKIEFYVSTTEIWAKKFREILENYMKVTVEQVETKMLKIPEHENVMLQEIRLSRHDIFSLRINASEQTTPIASILTALDDISMDGDFARLSVCTETFDRKQWARNGHWANEKLQKGVVPVRARITPGKVQKVLKKGVSTLANEVYDVLNDTMNAISNTFFKSEKQFEKKKVIDKKHALLEELNSSKPSQKSTDKLNEPVWKGWIRVAAISENKLRADLQLNTISSSFTEIAGDNELLPYKIRTKRRKRDIIHELNTLHLSQTTKADGDVSLFSCDEMSKIAIQMPTSVIQQRYESELAVNKKVETDISSIFIHKEKKTGIRVGDITISVGSNNLKMLQDEAEMTDQIKSNSILIGHAEFKGKEYPIGVPIGNPEETYKGYVMMAEWDQEKIQLFKILLWRVL
jgi:macrodomain Ter protein organizer (MatP/YcbG family)